MCLLCSELISVLHSSATTFMYVMNDDYHKLSICRFRPALKTDDNVTRGEIIVCTFYMILLQVK